MSLYGRYVKERMAAVLTAIGLDVDYERAEGTRMYYRDRQGQERTVVDLLAGYGSLITGHHHPEINAQVIRFLESQRPVHHQFSMKRRVGELAARLSELVRRDSGQEHDYISVFSNSGAEAVEIALKHAELRRVERLDRLLAEIDRHLVDVAAAVREARALVPKTLAASLRDVVPIALPEISFTDLLALVQAHNLRVNARAPLFVAVERSFHGKLLGSVQLTHGKAFRESFTRLGIQARFVAPDDPSTLAAVKDEGAAALLDLDVVDGEVVLLRRPITLVAAALMEPIQGEGGIRCLTAEFAYQLRSFCNALDCPLVVDEIQSGMGRTGRFLASADIGLKGDYYTLGKSLGGGLCKIAVTLIPRTDFQKDFGLIHSSTFAEDGLSTEVALTTLDILERDGGAAYAQVRSVGDKIKSGLETLKEKYPDVVKDVRGRGLMLAVEFTSQAAGASLVLRSASHTDSLGYLLCGYLLREHGIRAAPTGSSPNSVRIQPSLYITDEEIDCVLVALADVCSILRRQDAHPIVYHVAASERPRPSADTRDFRPADLTGPSRAATPVTKVAFVNHLIDPDWLSQADPSLADLPAEEKRTFVRKMEPNKVACPYPAVRIVSALGMAVDFILYPLCVSSEQMVGYLTNNDLEGIRQEVDDRVQAAKEDGCKIAGLGMYTSIVTNNCTSIKTTDIGVTSGNALTIAMGIEAIEAAVAERGRALRDLSIVVVGAAGNIATTYASILSESVGRLVLLGSTRDGSSRRLQGTRQAVYAETWQQIVASPDADFAGMTAHVRGLRGFDELLRPENRVRPAREMGQRLARMIDEQYGSDPFCVIRVDAEATCTADVVVCVANADRPFLTAASFKEEAVICDIAVPANVVADIRTLRPDLTYLEGGLVATPHGESLHPTARATLEEGQIFACMAETAVLGLSGRKDHFSYGPISRRQVKEISRLASLHGFSLAGLKQHRSL